MVYCGGEKVTGTRRAEGEAAAIEMMRMERSRVPIHNFTLPFSLKWGDQRRLTCKKLPADSSQGDAAIRVCRSNRSPSKSYVEEGIDEVREKIMLDSRTAADRMKHEFFKKSQRRVSPPNDEEEDSRSRSRSPPRRSPETEKEEEEVKLWNLRTRKAARKAPAEGIGAKVTAVSNSNFSAGKSEGTKLPTVLKVGGEKKEREEKEKVKKKKEKKETAAKLSVELSRKEIE